MKNLQFMTLEKIKPILIFLLFAALSSGIYSNTLKVPFVFDDTRAIKDNHFIRITSLTPKEIANAGFKGTKTRPVAFISFALNYYFHQYDLTGYHVVNILVHILTGILLYLFLKTTLNIVGCGIWDVRYGMKQSSRDRDQGVTLHSSLNPSAIAFFSALVWLVHPLHTQSVTYIVQRLNSMAAMFFLLSFLLYVKGRLLHRHLSMNEEQEKGKEQKSKGRSRKAKGSASPSQDKKIHSQATSKSYYFWYTGSALAWILGLGCKQTVATLPFIILLYEWYFFQGLSRDWLHRNLKYSIGALSLFGLIALFYLGSDPWQRILSIADYANNEFTLSQRVLTQSRVVIYYLSLIFDPHPSRLNLDYDFGLSHSLIHPVTTMLSLGVIIGLLFLAIYLAKTHRLISFCILWFFGNLVIESSVIPLAIIYEHRTYLPSMLTILIPVLLIYRYIKPEWIKVAVLCGIVVMFSVWTYERNSVWKDALTLWKDCVEKSPEKARPHYNLGRALYYNKRVDEAIAHYSEALRINPNHAEANNNMGLAMYSKGRFEEAISYYSKALRINPAHTEAHDNMGVALSVTGRLEEAIGHFTEALRINPMNAKAHNNVGIAFSQMGRHEEALDHFTEALNIKSDFAEAHNNVGIVYAELGRFQKALSHFKEALQINPYYIEAQKNMEAYFAHKEKDQ